MKSSLLIHAVPALFASTLFLATPAFAESDGRAVAQCRAELLSRFEPGAIRSYRIGEIAGNARRTRCSATRRFGVWDRSSCSTRIP